MARIVFASSNKNKLNEIRALLPKKYELLSLGEMHYTEEIEETGATLEENAAIKANTIFDALGYMCFADDSGLEVESLNGAPGVKAQGMPENLLIRKKIWACCLQNLQVKRTGKPGSGLSYA